MLNSNLQLMMESSVYVKSLEVLQDICQTDWNFLLDRTKICRIDTKSCLLQNFSYGKGCTIFVRQT